MTRTKREFDARVAENESRIAMHNEQFEQQEALNGATVEAFGSISTCIKEMDREIRCLNKLAAGLAFISGVMLGFTLKSKIDIQEIRKKMNEG